jgi:hypothetical protein
MEPSASKGNADFNNWIETNGKNYAAHATKNHKEVLKEKVLMSAEEILRKKGSVEHESGNAASRSVTKMENYKESKVLNMLFLEKVSKKRGTIVETTIYPNYSKEAFDRRKNKSIDPQRVKVKDHGEFIAVKRYTNDKPRQNLPKAQDIQATLPGTEARSLVKDEKQGRPVDQQLRKIYTYVLKKGISPDMANEKLFNMRGDALNTHVFRLENMLSISKNSVWWGYGPVAILIGRPEEKVASKEAYSKAEVMEGESRLKGVYQSEDGFYQEKLDAEENRILGPKYLLDKYRNDPEIDPKVKERFVNIESLTPEQWPLFGLDEKKVKELCTPNN